MNKEQKKTKILILLFHTTQNVTQRECDQPFQQSEKLYTNVRYLRSYSIHYNQPINLIICCNFFLSQLISCRKCDYIYLFIFSIYTATAHMIKVQTKTTTQLSTLNDKLNTTMR